MASDGYPKVSRKAWIKLRARASAAPSTKFTPSSVAAMLGQSSPKSALSNTLIPLRRLGLLDDDGALTPLGNKWRIDGSYADACEEILDAVYPAELAALTSDSGEPDPDAVRTWFGHKGFGDSNARQMAATFVMIAAKKPPEPTTPEPKEKTATKAKGSSGRKSASPAPRTAPPVTAPFAAPMSGTSASSPATRPNVHLDIQIHIPADASAEQIDQIFESMARHLYKP